MFSTILKSLINLTIGPCYYIKNPSLLYQESRAIQRRKPELNHGIKASKELIIFN